MSNKLWKQALAQKQELRELPKKRGQKPSLIEQASAAIAVRQAELSHGGNHRAQR